MQAKWADTGDTGTPQEERAKKREAIRRIRGKKRMERFG